MKPENLKEISLRRRIAWLALAWGITAILTLPGIVYPQMLPAGLFRLFGIRENELLGRSWLVAGWLAYLLLTVAALASRHKRVYFTLYATLCVILLLSSAGCRVFWWELKDAH